VAPQKIESWRVFCAIELPSVIREQIGAYSNELRTSVPHARASWSRPENIHLTLKFLGDVPRMRVEALSQASARAVEKFSSFEIQIGGTGAFPPHGSPRVLWIGITDGSGKLAQLQKKLDLECTQVGFEPESRAFNPHLTIARLRRAEGAAELARVHKQNSFAPLIMKVSELVVIRSELSNTGSRYNAISRHQMSDKL